MTLQELVDAMADTAFVDAEEGATVFAFVTRETPASLEADEAAERIDDGRGVMVLELVYNRDLDLDQRGEGRVVRSMDELIALLRTRAPTLLPRALRTAEPTGGVGRSPELPATAPMDEGGRGRPKPKTAVPWHPSSIPLKPRDR